MNQGPLSGIRVIDLSIAAAGPYATAILAAQGAEVIKVERPDGGDFMRGIGTVSQGVSACFASWNRGKQSICIDLKQPAGAALVRKLVANADVFVHNLRPGNAEDMGLGYDDLRALKPDLIYACLTGWGETGPRAGEPAYDSVMQAAAGYAAVLADPDSGEPQFVRNAVCDKTSGLTLAQMITAALFFRQRTGEGQRLHLSMLHAALSFIWADGMQPVAFIDDQTRLPRAASMTVRRTADGWISVSCNLDHEFQSLCKALGLQQLAADPRFMKAGERSRNAGALWTEINPILAQRRSADLVALFTASRIPHAVVNTMENVHEDAQVVSQNVLEISVHPDAGRVRVARPPGDFSATPLASPSPAPRLGEHTDALLASVGASATEIAALHAAHTVA